MATYRPRGSSPPPPRRYGDPRASTGAVIASSFDPRYASSYPRSSIDALPPTRGAVDRSYDAQPITKRVYPDQNISGGTKSRTEYAVRPRNNSVTAEERRRPISIAIPPTSGRPIVSNNNRRDLPSSPAPRPQRAHDDSERYIYPAVSSPRQNHQRHYSATPAEVNRLSVTDRERRERARYRDSGSSSAKAYPATGAPARYRDDDVSYTGPREQFDRDYPSQAPPPARRDSHSRRERPSSALDFADWKPPPTLTAKRDMAPPPPPAAVRQLQRIDKADTSRPAVRSGGGSDNERESSLSRRRNSVRAPVSLHQDRDVGPPHKRDDYDDRRDIKPRRDRREEDDTYASDRDHRDHQLASNHQERKHRKHRDASPVIPDVGEKVAAVGLGSVAAAGLASVLSKKSRENDKDEGEDPQRERRHRRHREKEVVGDETLPPNDARSRDRIQDVPDAREMDDSRRVKASKDRADSDSLEDDASRHRRRRRRHRSKDESQPDGDSGSGSDRRNSFDRSREEEVRGDRDREPETEDHDRRRRERERRQGRDASDVEEPGYNGVPGEEEDDRPRRVQLVEPPREKDQELKPKGILKPARQVPFPEDPNPTREGVAPLKEAGKKGIPPGARWTKINRMLVNPAALEALHERFEERDEYVIVLRVLTREEIEKFAALTTEIREAREKEWQENHKDKENNSRDIDDYSSDEDDRRVKPALAIEPPPSVPPADLRYFQGQVGGGQPVSDFAPLAGFSDQV